MGIRDRWTRVEGQELTLLDRTGHRSFRRYQRRVLTVEGRFAIAVVIFGVLCLAKEWAAWWRSS